MYLYKKCSVKVKLQYRQKTTQFSHFPETRMYRDFQPRYEPVSYTHLTLPTNFRV